jgi:hypothetical protein
MFLHNIREIHQESIIGGTSRTPSRCIPHRPPATDKCCPTLTRSVSNVSGQYNANLVGNDDLHLSGGSFIQIGPYTSGG